MVGRCGRYMECCLGRDVETFQNNWEKGGKKNVEKASLLPTTPYPDVETYSLPLSLLSLYPPLPGKCDSTALRRTIQIGDETFWAM
jgi:hypothetical protein